MRISLCFLFLTITFTSFSQEKKNIEALLIQTPLTIDGELDEDVYKTAKPAKDFIQLQPNNGKPSLQPSSVYFFYDQSALYVGAMLYDSAPDSIFNYFTERDNIGMSDYFGVYIDPYNQGQLAYGFFITPASVQTDIKAVKRDYDYEDGNWNAVWESKAKITKNGWVLEMRIPYSALRFPESDVHTWGLNMFRNIRRYNSNNSWNLVDRNVSGFIHQQGVLTGIKNIKPPVRLSLSPYTSSYLEYKDKKSTPDFVYKGGMDLKYGINESFTLDMMLIPDFGQIQSDDKQLNLSPYELFYDEKRQFFTEGTELFQRGDIFYSRRIGASPKFADRADDALSTNEIVDYKPNETQLINATKVSGRTTNGWGLGMLNAISLPSYAKLRDTITGHTRQVLIQPFTNYNISVVDKSLKNNSYISLINSNMYLFDDPFSANVTATEFQLRDKSKTYALSGKAGISTRGDSVKENGFYSKLGFDKNSGKLNFGIFQEIISDKYNTNDMGYLRRNNQMLTESYIYYQHIEPYGIFNEWNANIWWDYYRIIHPSATYDHEYGFNSYARFKNNYALSLNGGVISTKYDYYEPRVSGRYFTDSPLYFYHININTDRRKKLSCYMHYGGSNHPSTDQIKHLFDLGLTAQIGQRLQINYSWSYVHNPNNIGYVDKTDDDKIIYFAKRDINTISEVIEASYAFTNKASFHVRTRHYWTGAKNKTYYQLQQNGSLEQDLGYTENKDNNYNSFATDASFRWIFAPGSEMSLVWKNSLDDESDHVSSHYSSNLERTWNGVKTNSFSLKVLYYIDFNTARAKLNKALVQRNLHKNYTS